MNLAIMGKEWYCAGRSFKRGGGAAGAEGGAADTETPPGCLCSVFQFFDFHPFHFPIQQQQASFKTASCVPEVHGVPKGAEAPRNSLDSEEGRVSSISKENLKLPKSMQIKTSGSTRARAGNANDISSEVSCSPGTKTPTLVARLMGLDLLPDAPSPSSSSSFSSLSTTNPQENPHLHHLRPRQHIQTRPRNSFTDSDIAAPRSLPETPRISSARRSDVDHHRLSLQLNKGNMGIGEDLELPRFSFSKRKSEEHSISPSHYARQIAKQVKDSVSRKVGLDITNTVKDGEQVRDDQFVGQVKVKKSSKTSFKVLDESRPGKQSNPSCSPRLRFIDNKPKPVRTTPSPLTQKDQNSHPAKPPSPPPVKVQPQLTRGFIKPKPQAFQEQEFQNQKVVPKCRTVANEKFSSRLKKPLQTSDMIRNKQEESFVRPPSPITANDKKITKCKKSHPLSSNLLHLNTVTNLLPVTGIPQKQSQVSDTQESKRSSQLSSCSRQEDKQEATSTLAPRESNDEDKFNGASPPGAHYGPEFQYITGILSRTGVVVDKGAPTVSPKWPSPTCTLDPSNFHQFEQNTTSISTASSINNDQKCTFMSNNQMGVRCNRRLLFDLVNEILGEIQRHNHDKIKGSSQLIETVWKKVRSFPSANCEFLEDIDGLVELDLRKMKLQGAEVMEEGEGIAAEIEGKVLDMLVHETVVMAHSASVRRGRRRLDGSPGQEGAGAGDLGRH